MSVADKLSLIAENQTKVFEAGQKSMYDESKVIEKTVSAMRKLELTDVSEVIHTVHCKVEEYIEPIEEPLFDITKYSTVGGKVAFDISKLAEGQTYVLKSVQPLKNIKISNSPSGYNSLNIMDNTSTEIFFTMTRHPNIEVTSTQYLFFAPINNSSYISDPSVLEDYNIRIELTRMPLTEAILTINGTDYPLDETGELQVKSDSSHMTFSIVGSWKLTVNYHKSIGAQVAYDIFWDNFQSNGARLNYQYGFGLGWDNNTFKPKHPIIFGRGYTGAYCFWNTSISNIAERLEEMGVYMDTTQCGNWNMMFQLCKTKRLPELNCTYAHEYNKTLGLYYAFNQCTVETIDKLIVNEQTYYSNTFNNTPNLKNIVFEGVIAQTINFQWSPLSVDSMKSVISCLKDFSETADANTRTLTFSETCWTELEASGSSPTGGTWEDYVTSLGWNV